MVAKPARGQLNREIKRPCRCIRRTVRTYVLLFALVYRPGISYIWVDVYYSCTVHCGICIYVTTAVSVHIIIAGTFDMPTIKIYFV